MIIYSYNTALAYSHQLVCLQGRYYLFRTHDFLFKILYSERKIGDWREQISNDGTTCEDLMFFVQVED